MRFALLVAVLVGALGSLPPAGYANADVWQRAVDGKPAADVIEKYDAQLALGDEAAVSANSKSISRDEIRRNLDTAIAAYRNAAKTNPKAAEPYFRIAKLLHSFYFDCNGSFGATRPLTCDLPKDQKMKELVEAWDAFEARAPLDPRVTDILFERAINRTKLVSLDPNNKALLEGALRDYKALINRANGMRRLPSEALGNFAETYMMLGMLDDAIDAYKDAVRGGGSTSIVYGLAIALDRDQRGSLAFNLIKERGWDEYIEYRRAFDAGDIFYVPAGEEHYYFAVILEAFGNFDGALVEWRAYIKSGAHPQYQPRAREHIKMLSGKRNKPWRAPESPDQSFPRLGP